MSRPRVSIIGAGNVGAAAANWIAQTGLADLALIDIVSGVPQGKALDLQQALPILGTSVKVTGSNDYGPTKDSDIVVITAGVPRKEGQSREDLIATNVRIVSDVTRQVVALSPGAILIVVSNPLDAMVYTALKVSGFPKARVLGMAGVLDAARFRAFVALELGVSAQDVAGMVLGGHGDQMVPLPRFTAVNGVPVTHLLPKKKLDAIIARTRQGGGEFLPLLKTSAWVAPGAAVAQMVEAILLDQKRLLPCAAYLEGEYGESGLFIGVPVIVGAGGVERIVELPLDGEERRLFQETAQKVRETLALVKI